MHPSPGINQLLVILKRIFITRTLLTRLLDWAQSNMGKCIFRHSKSPYGENLAGESGSTDPNRDVMHEIKMWYDEGDKCDYNTPSYSHFTALIWNSVTSIGCARVYCDPVMNEDGSKGFSGW